MMGLGWMGLGGLFMIAFWIFAIAGGVWLVTTLVRNTQSQSASHTALLPPAPAQTPLEVLKLRYAKGEINKEQYEQMKQDLGV